jgi:Tfp pilus assembly protein PilO
LYLGSLASAALVLGYARAADDPILWIALGASFLATLTGSYAWRGASWARLALAAGWLASLGLVGALGYTLLRDDRDAMGAVALLILAPLFMLTILLRSDVREESRRRWRLYHQASTVTRLRPAAVITLGALLLVAGLQHLQFASERQQLDRCADAVRRRVSELEVVAAKLEEFKVAVEEQEASLSLLRQQIPQSLESPTFLLHLQRLAREGGIVIDGWTRTRSHSELFDRAEITLRLTGAPQGLAHLAERVEGSSRLAIWRTRHTDPRGATATVSIYAVPPAAEPPPRLCAAEQTRVWLWPYTTRLRPLRKEIQYRQARMRELEVVRVQVDALSRRRRLNERLARVRERLRSQQTTRQIASPSA